VLNLTMNRMLEVWCWT